MVVGRGKSLFANVGDSSLSYVKSFQAGQSAEDVKGIQNQRVTLIGGDSAEAKIVQRIFRVHPN
jgi:hypothetical protein